MGITLKILSNALIENPTSQCMIYLNPIIVNLQLKPEYRTLYNNGFSLEWAEIRILLFHIYISHRPHTFHFNYVKRVC